MNNDHIIMLVMLLVLFGLPIALGIYNDLKRPPRK